MSILNPFKFDWQQRFALAIAVSAFAYLVAHTVHKPKASVNAESDPRIGSLEQQIAALKSQQEKLLEQQAESGKEKKRKREIREKLGELLGRGQQLMALCANEKVPAPENEANKWAEETEKFLQKNLGPDYVSRFRSGSGMPLTATSISEQTHRNLWSGLNIRVYRLEQFLSELRD